MIEQVIYLQMMEGKLVKELDKWINEENIALEVKILFPTALFHFYLEQLVVQLQ